MSGKFKIDIASVPDREKLVAEIWFEDNLVAEINQEHCNLEIEIYSMEKLRLPLIEFQKILQEAEIKLH